MIKKRVNTHTHKQEGYILLLTILITSLMVVIATFIFTRGSIFVPFADTVIKREKATMLCLGGVEIGLGMLHLPAEEKKEAEQKTEQSADQKKIPTPPESPVTVQAKMLFKQVIPYINRPQTITLQQKNDGMNGEIICVLSCEEGKLDINAFYDFKKHQFIGEKTTQGNWKLLVQELFKNMQPYVGGENLFPAFEKFLKSRQDKLDDVTELLNIPEFAVFKNSVFMEPMNTQEKKNKQIYLTDIFTVHTGKTKIEPWLFSESLKTILGLENGSAVQQNKELLEKTIQSFQPRAQWRQDWNSRLKPFYAKELQSLPKGIESVLSTTFEPMIFSVIVQSKVDAITQRLYAIIQRVPRTQKGKTMYESAIKKLYWI